MREWFKKLLKEIYEANIQLAEMGIYNYYGAGYICFWMAPELTEQKNNDE